MDWGTIAQVGGSLIGGLGGMIGGGQSAAAGIPQYVREPLRDITNQAMELAQQEYTPYTGSRVAPFSADQLTAFQGIRDLQGRYGGLIDSAGSLAMAAGQRGLSGLSPSEIQNLMNPYQQQVIDVTKQEAVRDYEKFIAPELRDSAIGASAFGGERHGLMEAENQRNLLRNLSDIQMRGSQQAYDQAMQYGYRGTDQALSASGVQADLARAGQQYNLGDLAALENIGASQQQLGQLRRDIRYEDFLREQDDPYTRLQWGQSMLGNAQSIISRGAASAPPPDVNPISRFVGGALTGSQLGGGLASVLRSTGPVTHDIGNAIRLPDRHGTSQAGRDSINWWAEKGGPVGYEHGGGVGLRHFEKGGPNIAGEDNSDFVPGEASYMSKLKPVPKKRKGLARLFGIGPEEGLWNLVGLGTPSEGIDIDRLTGTVAETPTIDQLLGLPQRNADQKLVTKDFGEVMNDLGAPLIDPLSDEAMRKQALDADAKILGLDQPRIRAANILKNSEPVESDTRTATEKFMEGVNMPLLKAGLAMMTTPGGFNDALAAGGNAAITHLEQEKALAAEKEQLEFERAMKERTTAAYEQQVELQDPKYRLATKQAEARAERRKELETQKIKLMEIGQWFNEKGDGLSAVGQGIENELLSLSNNARIPPEMMQRVYAYRDKLPQDKQPVFDDLFERARSGGPDADAAKAELNRLFKDF